MTGTPCADTTVPELAASVALSSNPHPVLQAKLCADELAGSLAEYQWSANQQGREQADAQTCRRVSLASRGTCVAKHALCVCRVQHAAAPRICV